MKKINFSLWLLFFYLLSSCSLFQSKDELLTKSKWILYSKFNTTNNKLEFFKKLEEKQTFFFNKDGSVDITEDNVQKFATILWEWGDNDKEYIKLIDGNKFADYHLYKLSNSTLEISKSEISSMASEFLTYKHIDDVEWNDKKIEEIRKIQ